LYFVIPNFANFKTIGSRSIIPDAGYHLPIDPAAVGWITFYDLAYCAIVLSLSIIVFARRDFK
jgi:hypothetical protein